MTCGHKQFPSQDKRLPCAWRGCPQGCNEDIYSVMEQNRPIYYFNETFPRPAKVKTIVYKRYAWGNAQGERGYGWRRLEDD